MSTALLESEIVKGVPTGDVTIKVDPWYFTEFLKALYGPKPQAQLPPGKLQKLLEPGHVPKLLTDGLSFTETEKFKVTDWQKEDIRHFLKDPYYSANWSQMGCFKTSSALWFVENKLRDKKDAKVLIITTKMGKGTYFEALPALLPNYVAFNVNTRGVTFLLNGKDAGKKVAVEAEAVLKLPRPTVFLAHYHCFLKKSPIKELLYQQEWDVVIVDEAHRLKDDQSQWTRGIKKVPRKYSHPMTGTGFINNPLELWSILNFMDRKTFSSKTWFKSEYCLIENYTGFEKIVGVKPEKLEEFRAIRKAMGPRRLMTEVHSNIPEPIRSKIPVELNPTQKKMYKDIVLDLMTMDKAGVPITSPNVLSQLQRLRQIAVATPRVVREWYDPVQERRRLEIVLEEPSSKLDATMEILENLEWSDEERQQVVVFSNFKDPLELLKVRLDRREIPYIHLKESDNERARDHKWRTLFPRKEHQVFLSTLQLGSESINLSPASYCIRLDRSWSPKDNEQAIGRVFRPGQTKAVEVIDIEAVNTVDRRIEGANFRKQGWFNEIFGDDDDS